MKKLSSSMEFFIADLAGDSEQARINLRANQVRNRYAQVIRQIYHRAAELFLKHTNNVYIVKDKGVATLIVYVDESIFSAELNAQRELIKLKLLETYGEPIDDFKIYVSRGAYKNYHPYIDEEQPGAAEAPDLEPLEEHEQKLVEETASTIEDESVRKSLEKAMTADLGRKKQENRTLE